MFWLIEWMHLEKMMVLSVNLTKVALGCCVIAAVFVTVAAHADDSSIKGDGGKVRLLFSPFGTNSYPPFVMQKFALDKKHGFELQLVPGLTDQARIVVLQAGGADLATLDWAQIIRLRGQGLDLVAIGPLLRWGADFILIPADSNAKNFGDLKGKRLGLSSKFATNYIAARTVAKNIYHVDLEAETEIHEGAMPLLAGLLEQHQLDASEIFNSVAPELLVSGKMKVLYKMSDLVHQMGLPDTPYVQYAARAEFVKSNPANARAFMAAYRDAIQILATNDEVWLEKGRELKQSEKAAIEFRAAARSDLWEKYGPTTKEDLKKVIAALLKAGGTEILGFSRVPDDFMTSEFQQ
jgi:ABC-type nitrate/sulfonate/bicarbonate transport system substrate-binding protein